MARSRIKEKAPPYRTLFERFFLFYKERPLFAITISLLLLLVLAAGITLWNSRKRKEEKAWAALTLSSKTISDLKASLEEYKGTPAEPWILYRLAKAIYSQGGLSEATSTYQRLSREFPHHYLAGPALYSLGQLYEEAEEEDKARQIYARLIDVKGATFWAQKARERFQGLRASTAEVSKG